jgi:hypothetical protein
MEEGKKEDTDNCIMNPGKCSAHSACILCKECRRYKYKNRKLLIRGVIETKESCKNKILERLMQVFPHIMIQKLQMNILNVNKRIKYVFDKNQRRIMN